MHKYQPRLHIVQSPDPSYLHMSGGYLRFTFPEAAFIAVTAYQNQEVKHYTYKCSLDMSDPVCLLKEGFSCEIPLPSSGSWERTHVLIQKKMLSLLSLEHVQY